MGRLPFTWSHIYNIPKCTLLFIPLYHYRHQYILYLIKQIEVLAAILFYSLQEPDFLAETLAH